MFTVSYYSSEWERLWIENIRKWQNHGICEALVKQKKQVFSFMNDTCGARTDTPWCLIDDSVHKFWYHTFDGRMQARKPKEIREVFKMRGMSPSDPKIWSWFEHRNVLTGEITHEYIEPLVSHLRHPLARCGVYGEMLLVDRSYVLPGVPGTKTPVLFDAGASSWNEGAGGPSLSYFVQVWKRHGFDWKHIEAWEGKTSPQRFYSTVPQEWITKTEYHQQWISTTPLKHPFVPSVIQNKSTAHDYVVFKLDIDSKSVETSIVDYMIKWEGLFHIDEFLWEHHVDNYLMAKNWGNSQDLSKKIADSYDYFLRLRQKGVRAHSWV